MFAAAVDGVTVTTERYAIGNGDRRRKVAELWSQDERLRRGSVLRTGDIAAELDRIELAAINEKDSEDDAGDIHATQAASYVDETVIVELAWNLDDGGPDFIVYDRESQGVTRSGRVEAPIGILCPPVCARGICTPGGSVPGTVLLPTEYSSAGLDEDRLRGDVLAFVNRYVELPGDAAVLAVEYVLLTWVHDAFDEVPYGAYRTPDIGRGKSRALDTVGTVCYRPILCGGGSTAAATLRLLDQFGGTLVADEYDQRDTDLSAELTKIINQGFQKNRPLVRCTGEDNEPHPFRCFGPKLFALRKGFADDATESRIISIRMKQRTRDDVPISLPRQRFEREGLALRNRLLAYRFAKLGKVATSPEDADPRLEDRLNQIGLPLMAVAGDRNRHIVVKALLQQQDHLAADRADSLPGEVFEAVLAAADGEGVIRPGKVAQTINEGRAAASGVEVDRLGNRGVNPWKVGRVIAGELDLRRGKRDRGGACYHLDPVRKEQLCQRFGVDPPETTQTSQRHTSPETTPENPLCEAENADGDVSDVPDVSSEAWGRNQ